MPDFTSRSQLKEILDQDDIPFEEIKKNLVELDFINTWLGGHAITKKGIALFDIKKISHIHIAELGCGGGDNLRIIAAYLTQRKISHTLTGIDLKPACIQYAREKNPSIQWICSDYKLVHFEKKPDILFSSLFCHHFSQQELIEQLQWMKANSTQGFFINDLQRHPLAYYAIQALTQLFSTSYLVKHDAPLSVARAYTKAEWATLFKQANLSTFTIQWKWAFRFLIHYKHE